MQYTYKRNIYRLITVALFIMLTLSITSTFGYFRTEEISGNTNLQVSSLTIGAWTQAPEGIDAYSDTLGYGMEDLVWFEGDFWIYKGNYSYGNEPSIQNGWTYLNDLNWYSNIIYQADEIVYYNGIVYQTSGYSDEDNPENGSPWVSMMNNQVQWTTGDATTTNEQVYHEGNIWVFRKYYTTSEPGSTNEWSILGDLTFSTNYVYENGDVTLYNGNYYITDNGGWATGNTPGNPYGPWDLLDAPTWSSSIGNVDYSIHNGHLYKALVSNRNQKRQHEPGTASAYGVWTRLDSQQWQQYNTYEVNDLVLYNGDVFMLANAANSTIIPGTAGDSWNFMNNMGYDSFNTYNVGDFVVINDVVYEVVNQTNANNNAPETSANSWNRLSGYNWYWFNVYDANDIVYHEDGVYIALTSSTNIEPGTTGSETYWQLYNQH